MNAPDPLATLTALRPTSSVAYACPAQPPAHPPLTRSPAGTRPRPQHRTAGRIAAVTAAVGLTLTGGVGLAAATGLLPDSFTHAFSYWADPAAGVDPGSAVRVGTAPGPGASVFTVVEGRNSDGRKCIAPLFETTASSRQPGPSVFQENGSSCFNAPPTEAFAAYSQVNANAETHTFSVPAGRATAAQVRLDDGTVLATVFAEGQFFGWFPTQPGTAAPVITGYDQTGQVVGAAALPQLR